MFQRSVLITLLLVPLLSSPARAQRIEGEWVGVADRHPDSGLPVTLRLRIHRQGDSLRVALSLPESRLIDLELPSPYSDSSHAIFKDNHLHLEFTPDIGLGFISRIVPREQERIVFDGDPSGEEIRGEIQITAYRSPIRLHKATHTSPLHDRNVRFYSDADSLPLGGGLLVPGGKGPFPAVVFVTGSDPDTREAWGIEAEALARKGIASLRYDKRGVGESSGASHDLASWDDLAGDAEGAAAFLRTLPDLIDAGRIGLIGQSQGTWIIAKVAARDPKIRFLVSISGSGISAAEQETYRTGALMKADGFTDAEVERARLFQRRKFQVAKTGLGWESLDSTMKRLRADSVRWFPGYGTGAAARSLSLLRLYGVLQFTYDPTRDVRRIKVPVLVVMGENDLVFPPQMVIEKMRRALLEGGNHDYTARVIPGAGHGLTSVQTIDGRPFRRAIDPEFLKTLVDWVSEKTRSR